MNTRLFILFTVFLVSAVKLSAQVLAITKDGQRVILYTNGTWKFEAQLDSAERQAIVDGNTLPAQNTITEVPAVVKPTPAPKPPRVYSLECSALINVEKDITSDAYTAVSKTLSLMKEDSTLAFTFSMMKTKKSSLMWTIKIPNKPCVTVDNKILIVLKDGVRYTLVTDSKPNCDGEWKLNFGNLDGKDIPLASLKETEISAVRIFTAKGYVETNFDEENAKKLKAAINCMAKNL